MIVQALAQSLPRSVRIQGATYDPAHVARWRAWLSDEEQALLSSFGAEVRRHEFLAGRAAARTLLGACLGRAPADVPLRRAEDGAVDVKADDWRVSIAHSGGRALAAAARHPVGADLEEIRPRDAAVADFLFRPDERDCVDALPYAFEAALVLCWALKESVLKARRTGFRMSPKALRLTVVPERDRAVVQVEEGEAWIVCYTRLGDYWGAVAVPDEMHSA